MRAIKLGKKSSRYHPDWEIGNIWVDVKANIQAIRTVRDSLLRLVYSISENSNDAILFLIEPHASETRLYSEWQNVTKIFCPEILKRLSIVIAKDGKFVGFPEISPKLNEYLKEIYKSELSEKKNPLPKANYKAEIIKILIYKWFMKEGAVTSDWLAKTAGCNYRTVANVLKELGDTIIRHSDRRVGLKYFPKEAWQWLLVNSDKTRLTKRYSDCSGQPRSIKSMLKRLAKMEIENVAVSGTLGASHYYPDIDLVGTPRLDLIVNCPGKYTDFGFIERLDPALKEESEKPVSVALHIIRRNKPFFKDNSEGLPWADPVECLLDLHQMRLESQALSFLNYFSLHISNPFFEVSP